MAKHPSLPIHVRQFAMGAEESAKEKGITVIIDNFRASNTILALLAAQAVVTPVETIDEALSLDVDIRVGEKDGKRYKLFHFDNSPYTISQNAHLFKDKRVGIRTTNGTRGIIKALGSHMIIVGSFRNLDAVVDYCLRNIDKPISFIAMGSKDIPRIEDIYGAKMMFYRLLERIEPEDGQRDEITLALESEDNPWNRDWVQDIKIERKFHENNSNDRLFSLQLNQTSIVPVYNQEKRILEVLQS